MLLNIVGTVLLLTFNTVDIHCKRNGNKVGVAIFKPSVRMHQMIKVVILCVVCVCLPVCLLPHFRRYRSDHLYVATMIVISFARYFIDFDQCDFWWKSFVQKL